MLKIALRFVLALLPVLAAFGVANLVYVVKYLGLFALANMIFPGLLQIKSILACKKEFSFVKTISESPANSRTRGRWKSKKSKVVKKDGRLFELLSSFCSFRSGARAVYMTPYSYPVLSHPVSVGVVVGVGAVLLVLVFSNLFVQPEKLTCNKLVTALIELFE